MSSSVATVKVPSAYPYAPHLVRCFWNECLVDLPVAPLSFKAATYSGIFTLLPMLTGEERAHHGAILREVARMVETGKVTVRTDPRRFGLDTVCDAYRVIKVGESRGKLIVDIAPA